MAKSACSCVSKTAYQLARQAAEYRHKAEIHDKEGHTAEAVIHRAWASGLDEAQMIMLEAVRGSK